MRTTLINQAFISCMTTFKGLIYNICQILFKLKPNALSAEKRSLSLTDLRQLGSVDDAIEYIIESESDEIMRKSMSEWFDFLRDKFEINIRQIITFYDDILENYQRRNVIIHHGSRASKQYIDSYGRKRGIIKGQRLNADEDYFYKSLENIYSCGAILINRAWKISKNHELEQRQTVLNILSIMAMSDHLWGVVENICAESIQDKQLKGSQKMTAQVNLWLSRKKTGRSSANMAELEDFDHDVSSPKYSAIVYALKDDHDRFFQMGSTSGLKRKELESWPVFEGIRNDERYATLLSRLKNDT